MTGPRVFAWIVTSPLRYLVIAAWLAASIYAFLYLPGIGSDQGRPVAILTRANSAAGDTRLRSVNDFGFPLAGEIALVQRDPRGLSQEAQQRVVERAAAIDQGRSPEKGIIGALPVLNTLKLVPGSKESGTTAVTLLLTKPELGLYEQYGVAQRYERGIDQPGDSLVGITGVVPARALQGDLISSALPLVEIATVLLIAVLVAIRIRSLAAPLITLLAGGVSYEISNHVIAWGAQRTGLSIPIELQPLLVVLVLAVSTDYSIFLLSGTRSGLRAGERRVPAARRTLAEFAPVIFIAGLTVAGCTACLAISGLDFMRALGPALAMSVAIAMLVTLTLTPALLASLGRLAYWPALPPAPTDSPGERAPDLVGGLRRALAAVLSNRFTALVLGAAVAAGLLAAATGLHQLRLGLALVDDVPASSEPARAAAAASAGFAPGIYSPTVVLVEGPGVTSRRDALARLEDELGRQPGVAGVVGPREQPGQEEGVVLAKNGSAARFAVILADDPFSDRATSNVTLLERRLPALASQAGLGGSRLGVTGDTAQAAETIDAVRSTAPLVALAIAAVVLFFMALLLRSFLAPLYLLGASVLSAAAPLGLTALFFTSHGHPYQDFYVPLGVGVLLISVGSDYNLFVVARIWDRARTLPVGKAVEEAAPTASRAISTAAIALSLSFALLALVPLASFREFAFGMAAGALIDSYLVRGVLVPALVTLFGQAGLWPGWTRKTRDRPRFQVA